MEVDGGAGEFGVVRGVEETEGFEADYGGGEDYGHGEGEAFCALFLSAGEHAGGDGGSGAGEAAEGQGEALDDAHVAGLAEGDEGFRAAFDPVHGAGDGLDHLAAFDEAGDEDKDAGGEEGWGDEFKMAEEGFELGFGLAFEEGHLDDFFERFADDAGDEGGPDDEDGELLEGLGGGEIGALPGLPEVDDDGEHGAGVEHDEQERHLGRGRVEAHEFFSDDDVSGAGDGKELGQALDDGEKDDLQDRHGDSLAGEGSESDSTFAGICGLGFGLRKCRLPLRASGTFPEASGGGLLSSSAGRLAGQGSFSRLDAGLLFPVTGFDLQVTHCARRPRRDAWMPVCQSWRHC